MKITPGAYFDHYEILSPIGAGGRGEVYRARDTRLDREVAIKVLPAEFANDADRLHRFKQEAMATSALNHPNILTVYDFGTHEGNPYLVMELLTGEELRAQLDKGVLKELLKEIMPADPAGIFGYHYVFLTPDGKGYAYSVSRMLSDLYVVEGLK